MPLVDIELEHFVCVREFLPAVKECALYGLDRGEEDIFLSAAAPQGGDGGGKGSKRIQSAYGGGEGGSNPQGSFPLDMRQTQVK